MNIVAPSGRHAKSRAWALLIVMSLCAVGMLTLTGVMGWSNENSTVTARNNEYFVTTYAAEAATEKALASIKNDYNIFGPYIIPLRMASYEQILPNSSDSPAFTNYQFSGGGALNQIIVTNTASNSSVTLGPPYLGLKLLGSEFEIIASAENTNSMFRGRPVHGTVGQLINVGTVPIFQFAVFYNGRMEIDPGANMNITGLVHGNEQVYIDPNPGVTITFSNTVSAVNLVNQNIENPLDPSLRIGSGNIVFNVPTNADPYDNNVSPLTLPVGTNVSGGVTNASTNVAAILQIPGAGMGPTTENGANMLYNKADLIVLVSNNSVSIQTGPSSTLPGTTVSSNQAGLFVTTNQFYDYREGVNMDGVVLNVSNLNSWATTNTSIQTALGGRMPSSVYVADERVTSNATVVVTTAYNTNSWVTNTSSYPAGSFLPPVSTNAGMPVTSSSYPGSGTYLPPVTTNNAAHPKTYTYAPIAGYTYTAYSYTSYQVTNTNYTVFAKPAVMLTNGSVLPANGLSVATPDPLYVQGNWNVKTSPTGTSDAGQSDTTYTRPSALFSDSFTVLSSAWSPANNTNSMVNRVAVNDTVNAAVLTGNVPSTGAGGYYSGGVENFPRFMENWSSTTFTYNGSMICMFNSQIATGQWRGTGATSGVYNPPTRNWAFDVNFNDPTKLPPLTPQVTKLLRARWTSILDPSASSF